MGVSGGVGDASGADGAQPGEGICGFPDAPMAGGRLDAGPVSSSVARVVLIDEAFDGHVEEGADERVAREIKFSNACKHVFKLLFRYSRSSGDFPDARSAAF